MNEKLLIGKAGNEEIFLNTSMLNRHGLIAGATGSGKTVSLKVIAEKLSESGIPVIIPDIKGDLISLAKEGEIDENIEKRITELKLEDFESKSYPVEVFDIFQEFGIPIRTSISEVGPILLSRMLNLSQAQEGIINIAFKIADQEGLLLIDIKDLRQMLVYLSENKSKISNMYGNISSQSIGAIQRKLLLLEESGGDKFFGEIAFDIKDFFRHDKEDFGQISIINSKKLIENKTLYSTFLFWLLSKINSSLEEVGDLDKPKLVFFFDEAHILFDDANKETLDLLERLVKIIRSKGVGIFFVTQNPSDISDDVLNQLGNKIEHALRAYTAKEEKAIKAIAQSFRINEDLDIEEEIKNLEIGQAIVSTLDEDAKPNIAKKVMICPPKSYLGAVNDTFIENLYEKSDLFEKYQEEIDRQSAYEILIARIEEKEKLEEIEENRKLEEKLLIQRQKEEEKIKKQRQKDLQGLTRTAKTFGNSIVRSIGYRIGRDIYGMIVGDKKNKR